MARGLLSGLRVVELANGLGAAYCGKLLADAGAEVVAVEPPGGSRLRSFVLRELLGVREAELAALEAEQVTGTRAL
jgi:crotonobetainyl-CoA:carnitine CoA-transferase CaiB-like acyl-CoA transferase